MIRRSVLGQIAGLVSLAPFRVLRASAGTADGVPAFRRGIGVAHPLGWAEIERTGAYTDPAFGEERFRFTAEQRRAIRDAGFDFVRLVVDVGPFLAFDEERRARMDERLFGHVRDLLDTDLGVIVDLHPSRQQPAYEPPELTAGVDTPKFQGVVALLRRLAAGLDTIAARRPAGSRPRIALELMNEPEIPPAAWQPMLEAAYRAVRSTSPRLPIVIGGGSMNSAEALEALDMRPFAGDTRILYTFHDYSPWQFTHQGLRGNPAYVLDAVPYPAPSSPDAMIRATESRIAGLTLVGAENAHARAARNALIGYARSGFDRNTLEQSFKRVSAWRRAQDIPAERILLGEFGVKLTPYQRTPEGAASRERWLRDMRGLAEAHGFAWACWTYAGIGGFALAENETGPGFDAATRRALGLRSV